MNMKKLLFLIIAVACLSMADFASAQTFTPNAYLPDRPLNTDWVILFPSPRKDGEPPNMKVVLAYENTIQIMAVGKKELGQRENPGAGDYKTSYVITAKRKSDDSIEVFDVEIPLVGYALRLEAEDPRLVHEKVEQAKAFRKKAQK